MRAETRGKQRKCKQCTSDDHRPPMPGFALAADREARRDLKAGAGQLALFVRRLRKGAQRSRHSVSWSQCPLSGVKQTCCLGLGMSANDPTVWTGRALQAEC